VTPEARISRDQLTGALRAQGIESSVYYPRLVFDHECFRNDPRIGEPAVPRAAALAGEVLSLPVHPKLSGADLDRIVEGVRDAMT
jgi:perosamine synthetase